MTNTVTMTGMVLNVSPSAEYDRRLVILTRERGKISAFAKGARKPNSALLACCQPFTFGEFEMYEGRNSYTLVSAEISNYFQELRTDLDKIYYGMYFCEFADYYTRENCDETEVLKLLYCSLKALSREKIGIRLVRRIFELRLIALEGEGPSVFECPDCRSTEISAYVTSEGGCLCQKCITKKQLAGMTLSSSTIYTLQFIMSSSVEKLYTFTVSESVLLELETMLELHKKKYVDHEMKSQTMLQ